MQGRTLGHFLLLEPLGSGGMGVVYRARDLDLQRDVAIKVLRAESVGSSTARARLMREARMASSLNHPNVCTIFEVGETQGDAWIAMELVEGRPLSRVIGTGLPVEDVRRHAIEIADALTQAHDRGVVHRDLKSLNLMITRDGRIKVLDFGLARRASGAGESEVEGGLSLTETGVIVGTAHYLSPEVLRGSEADARSDLWALGVVLHEMLTGSLPFAGNTTAEVAAAILHSPPSSLPADVPAGMRRVVSRCLEKDPARRYARAGEVRAALETAQTDSPSAAIAEPPTREMRVLEAVAGPRRSGRLAWLAAIAVGVPLVLAALWYLDPGGWRDGLRSRGGARAIDAVAVLPLENMSGNADQEYFADGMTDELITSLGKISALRVIARSSVMPYKGTHKSLRDIARALNVAAVLEGSVLESKDKVRITAQLIRAATGDLLWSDSYERNLSDVISLQSEVALAIAQQIQVKLTPQERSSLGRASPINPDAHEAYLRGRYEWNRSTREEKEKGVDLLKKAVAVDPDYSLAYAGLADAYYSVSNWWMPPTKAIPLAKAAAKRALEIDPDLADAHALAGILKAEYDWDFTSAEVEFRRAVQMNPNSSAARLWYGYFLVQSGRFAESHEQMSAARDLDPLASYLRWLATWPDFYEGHYDKVIADLRDVIDIDPKSADSYSLTGECFEQKHDYARALVELRTAESIGTHAWNLAAMGRVYAEAGYRDSALAVARYLAQLANREETTHEYITPYGIATIYSALGDFDKALEWLDRGVRERSEDLVLIGVDPRMSRLRADPRLAEWMRRRGVPNPVHPAPPQRT